MSRQTHGDRLADAIVHWVVDDQQPLGAVEEESFRQMIRIAAKNPQLPLPGRKAIRGKLMTKAQTAKQQLTFMLKGVKPAATLDAWTSNTNVRF